jgi:UDPglucose 6-dehydrogenase
LKESRMPAASAPAAATGRLGDAQVNTHRLAAVRQLAAELLDRPYGPAGPDLSGVRVAVLGAAFKPNSDDVRDSPALSVVRKLARSGAIVTVYDPEGMDNAKRDVTDVTYAKALPEAVAGAELVCVLTEWEEFRNIDPNHMGEMVAGKRIIDGRNCLDPVLWHNAGWQYRGMGRPDPS